MLTELRIRNLAVIESVTLPVAPGFNVLSGETGAGKSIIVGALGLLLGERSSADVVRAGADRAVVEGVFDGSGNTALEELLDERGIDTEDGLLVLRREVAAGGKSRAWVNDVTVTTGALASIGRLLVNLHGQHESQALLNEDAQRDVLDALAGATDIAQSVRGAFGELEAIRASIEDLTKRRDEATKRADYLRHLVREIDEARLVPGEEERLDDEARRLTHAVELRGHIAQAVRAIEEGDDAAVHSLGTARRAVQAAARLDPASSGLSDAIDQALVTLQELARDLAAYDATLDSDPERLADVDRRRDQISRVTRKHGGTVETALSALREAKAELDVLDTAAVDLRGLTARAESAQLSLTEKAAKLTKLRQKASKKLAADVETLLPDLGLPGGKFSVHLEPLDAISSSGAERVEFRVALNVGHEARALARTASGGELSRVMLALKTILARLDRIPTLVFDEVDAGIGGTVALKVGDSLRRLAEHHQVLVITHLAQVAARAHHHVVVAKGSRSGISTADISVVQRDDRVTEVARMLGGDPSSKVSRAHAKELLEAAG